MAHPDRTSKLRLNKLTTWRLHRRYTFETEWNTYKACGLPGHVLRLQHDVKPRQHLLAQVVSKYASPMPHSVSLACFALQALGLGHGHEWMPTAYEAGLYRTEGGIQPWCAPSGLGTITPQAARCS